MSLTYRPDCRRLSPVDSASRPSCAVSFRPGTLGAASAAQEKTFTKRGNIMFLFPFVSALTVLALMLMRT